MGQKWILYFDFSILFDLKISIDIWILILFLFYFFCFFRYFNFFVFFLEKSKKSIGTSKVKIDYSIKQKSQKKSICFSYMYIPIIILTYMGTGIKY